MDDRGTTEATPYLTVLEYFFNLGLGTITEHHTFSLLEQLFASDNFLLLHRRERELKTCIIILAKNRLHVLLKWIYAIIRI